MASYATCDWCDSPIHFTVTAAYPVGTGSEVHPLFATYPRPFARVCGDHFAALVQQDAKHPSATPAYLVRQVAR